MFRALLLPILLMSIMACTPVVGRSPNDRSFHALSGTHLERRVIQSTPFRHVVFSRPGCGVPDPGPVYVFLEGDGQSWLRGGQVSADPTPVRPTTLELLLREESCAVAVARPCTFGLAASDPSCEPSVWTLDRYSRRVIESVVDVIEREVPADRRVVLVGVSGGGLIASHVAARLERVAALVTLGANLDLPAWITYHGYTSEILSHTPRSPFPLREDLVELHVLGSEDQISPPSLTRAFLGERAAGSTLLLEGADHVCCWAREWPAIRHALQQLMRRSTRS